MQNLYIHIGTHKTATTWLQHYLGKNSDKLNDHGFYYPWIGRITQAQHRLGQAIFARPNPHEALDNLPLWQKFRHELAMTGYKNIVISSEEFEWVKHPELIKRFLPDVTIHTVLYLRRQDDYLESLYGQQIRDFRPRLTCTIHEYLAQRNLNFLDYSRLVARWQAASDQMTLRIFDRKLMKGGDIGHDFLDALGIGNTGGFEEPTAAVIDHKASLDLRAQEFVRQCNTLPLDEGVHNQLVDKIVRLNKIVPKSKARLLSVDERRKLMSQYESSNRKIARDYPSASPLPELFAPIADGAPTIAQSDTPDPFETLLKVNNLLQLV
ncbi:hypothetical protein GL279_05885 [Paracoccus limosus]|uniref:Sulfotransferase domain-containing protein n=1 Tax=Paracoccus limosus TaxID=913252 RepID=A0A844H3T1_9RHOB|nr:hypothetical protein [Paracoccus limosus]MTH34130.1 hypothetical protein [Paracoccus limosus]